MQCLKCGNDFNEFYECPLCSEIWRDSGKFNRTITCFEDFLIAFFLAMMVVMVLMQVVMRNLFQSGILGGEDFIRHLVLWIAFIGAGVATRSKAHVRIDMLTHLVKASTRKYLDAVVDLFSCGVCLILTVASCQFVWIEFQSHAHSAFFSLPVWALQIVMPLGYLVIAIRFAHNSINGFRNAFRGEIK
ncbi:MAG: TRAP transporter small permease [Desulfobacteraceae bacterium]|nr:MAG: TRAP transporter small permease [Desulfobacteraceae bacterium]